MGLWSIKLIEHEVKHYYQPTNYTCSQSAVATLLSFFGQTLTPEEIAAKVPTNKNAEGEDCGTINQQLATWCISQGFDVQLHTADFQIIDLSWEGLPKEKLLERMEAAKNKRDVSSLGKEWSAIYMQSYIDFVNAGGNLQIHPYMTTELLDGLIAKSPLLLGVCCNVLYGRGRNKNVALRKAEPDDLEGEVINHSIVVYGKDGDNYLIAEPWEEPGRHEIEPERLLAAMTAAQVECDNLLFQLDKK